MKKKTMTRKLTLATETLRSLNGPDLQEAPAGTITAPARSATSKGQVTNCSICPGCTI